MKIWITGIAGFLGSHLADTLLAEGHHVAGNDNLLCGDINNAPKNNIGFTWYRNGENTLSDMSLDCRDYEAMLTCFQDFKPDVVVHCAATAHEGLSTFSPSFITRNIYEASVSTFSAAIASGVKRIVYMSSMSRYGTGVSHKLFEENAQYESHYLSNAPFHENKHLAAPVDPYAVAKVAAEDTLKILCDTHGVKWSILVPHNIIGTRQRSVDPFRNVAAIMINRCKQNLPPIIYGDGMQTRCFSPVADCLPSIVKAVHGEADGEVVNIGPDSGEISIKELAEKVIALTGYKGEPVYMKDRPNEVKHAYCSSDKARKLLGYEPKQSIDRCLREMVEYIQPAPFDYSFPLEIVNDLTPETWKERLI